MGIEPDAIARPFPGGAWQYAALGHFGRYGTALTELQRELVIVTTVRGVDYGWTHHGGLARALGVTDAQLTRSATDARPRLPRRNVLCAITFSPSQRAAACRSRCWMG